MSTYRAVVHYHFKKGMEDQGLKFLETELLKKAQTLGCHAIEFLQEETDKGHVIGLATWNSIEEAHKFQSHWKEKEKDLNRYCVSIPQRGFYKIRDSYSEKSRKVA